LTNCIHISPASVLSYIQCTNVCSLAKILSATLSVLLHKIFLPRHALYIITITDYVGREFDSRLMSLEFFIDNPSGRTMALG